MRTMVSRAILAGLVLAAGATQAIAGNPTTPVPEISPASLSGGLALLAGGVLIVRARLRK